MFCSVSSHIIFHVCQPARFLLTEHHLQLHQTPYKVVKVDGHVGVGVSGHQQLVDGVVEGEACRGTAQIHKQLNCYKTGRKNNKISNADCTIIDWIVFM